MKLSTKGRYAARAMLDLALHNEKKIVLLKDIARRQEISERYLENIMRILASNGLVVSVRGRNGGFSLTREPCDIKLSQIIQAVEGSVSPVCCVDNPKSCKRMPICVTYAIWGKLKKATFDMLDSITLEDMVKMQKEKLKGKELGMYYI